MTTPRRSPSPLLSWEKLAEIERCERARIGSVFYASIEERDLDLLARTIHSLVEEREQLTTHLSNALIGKDNALAWHRLAVSHRKDLQERLDYARAERDSALRVVEALRQLCPACGGRGYHSRPAHHPSCDGSCRNCPVEEQEQCDCVGALQAAMEPPPVVEALRKLEGMIGTDEAPQLRVFFVDGEWSALVGDRRSVIYAPTLTDAIIKLVEGEEGK